MHHIVFTRLGIGINRPAVFAQHIDFLENGPYRSLSRQTDQSFDWCVFVDRHIDTPSRLRFQNLLARQRNFHLVEFDPIEKGRMLPMYADLPAPLRREGVVICSRLDDDDALSLAFMAKLHEFVAARLPLGRSFSAAFLHGITAIIDISKYQFTQNASPSVGLSVISHSGQVIDVHSGNHNRVDRWMIKRGGGHHVIETEAPMWLYGRRSGSDSYAAPGEGQEEALLGEDRAFRDLLASFGLHEQWTRHMLAIIGQYTEKTHPVLQRRAYPRSALKAILLKESAELDRREEPLPLLRSALISAFYAL